VQTELSYHLPKWMKQIGDIVGYEPVPHWKKSLYEDQKSGITISGVPDDWFIRSDGSKAIIDWKTAKYSQNQDKLMPMYRVQIICYSILIDKTADLYLVYMEPQTEKGSAGNNIIDCGFRMEFSATVVPIENDKKKVREALSITREIFELQKPPVSVDGCKECSSLENIIELLK